jgi:hypothetical protein
MSGLENMDFGVGNLAPVSLGFRQCETGIVFSPDDEQGRLVLAKVLLPGRVRRDIAPVVVKQLDLDLRNSRLVQVCKLAIPKIGTVSFRMG